MKTKDQKIEQEVDVKITEEEKVKPRTGESRDDFIARCIPMMVDEGREQEQAVAMCYSMWREGKTEEPAEEKKKHVTFEVKATTENGNIRVVISKEILDRDGEVIDLRGMDLANYKKNPIMIWNHRLTDGDIEDVVGRLENLVLTKDMNGVNMLVGDAVFADHPKAQYLKKMILDGIISTVSVGFGIQERDGLDRSRIAKSELYEVSWVIVPANTEARVISKSINNDKQLTDDMYKKLLNYDDIHLKIKNYRKAFKELTQALKYKVTGIEEVDIENLKQLILKSVDSTQDEEAEESEDKTEKEEEKTETQPDQIPMTVLDKDEAVNLIVEDITEEEE